MPQIFKVLALCIVWLCLSDVQAIDSVPVLVAPFDAGPLAGDTILMNQMIQSGEPTILIPQETPGYMYNIREMARGKRWATTVFNTEDTIIQLAFNGGSDAIKEYLPQKISVQFKLIYCEAWWGAGKVFVTYDPTLKSLSDLKGKRISLGLRSQSDWGVYPRLFLEYGYGIDRDNADIRHLTPVSFAQQLLDGATDLAAGGYGTEPSLQSWLQLPPVLRMDAAGRDMHYLGIEANVVNALNAKFNTTWVPIIIPAGTLPGQKKDLPSAINRGYKAAHIQFPEQLAYNIVMSVAKLAAKMRDLHANWRLWSPELMVSGLSDENVHPGAKKAYQELGWWALRKASVPVTYPK